MNINNAFTTVEPEHSVADLSRNLSSWAYLHEKLPKIKVQDKNRRNTDRFAVNSPSLNVNVARTIPSTVLLEQQRVLRPIRALTRDVVNIPDVIPEIYEVSSKVLGHEINLPTQLAQVLDKTNSTSVSVPDHDWLLLNDIGN